MYTNVEYKDHLTIPDVSQISEIRTIKDPLVKEVLKPNKKVSNNFEDCWLVSVEKQLEKDDLFRRYIPTDPKKPTKKLSPLKVSQEIKKVPFSQKFQVKKTEVRQGYQNSISPRQSQSHEQGLKKEDYRSNTYQSPNQLKGGQG